MAHQEKQPFCTVAVPVFNEEKAVESTVRGLQAVLGAVPGLSFEIICVNDGSADRSGQILDSIPGIRVLHHRVNRGYGAALRNALDHSNGEWAIIVDADGTYPLQTLPIFLLEAQKGPDMVVGARQGVGINLSPFKRIARWILRKLVHMLTGTMVPDLNSGMRIFRLKLYREFRHLLPMGFSFTTTITVSSLYNGYSLQYIPIDYQVRTGASNIRPVSDFFRFTILIVRLCSYFEPLRFFLPLAGIFFVCATAKATRDILVVHAIGNLAAILFASSVQVFVTGILADAIAKRGASLPGEK